jgi:endonuclease/exonuclease/phosphatase family metal-dependent hydrolase
MRARLRTSLTLLAVSACGPVPLEPRDPTPGVPHFVVETYNILDTNNGDPLTLEAVGAADADVVCLQEVTPVWEQAVRARYQDVYPFMLFRPREGSAGLGFLSRFPLTDLGFHEEIHGWHPAWHAQVDTEMGPVQILNVHLRSMFTGRSNAVEAYFSTSADHRLAIEAFSSAGEPALPTLVVGDFNEGPDGSAVTYLEGLGFQNALPLYHPGQPTWHDTPSWQMEQTIDHILFDGAFVPLNSWVESIGHSDHMPVFAHIEAAPR